MIPLAQSQVPTPTLGAPPKAPPVQSAMPSAVPVPFKPVDAQNNIPSTSISGRVTPNNPATLQPTPAPVATPSTPQAPAPPVPLATSPTAAPYATASTNTPGGAFDYLTKTIAPGAGVDRLSLAKSNLENYNTATDPEYKASINEAAQGGAAAGQIGSGQLRTRIGDLALARTRDLSTQGTKFLNDATSGSIDDAYKNINIAQDQQRFQAGQQETAFSQAQRQQAMDEALRSGDFQRYYQLLQAGYQGNPSDTQLALAGDYGAQASDAGKSAGSLAGNAVLAGRKNPLPLAS